MNLIVDIGNTSAKLAVFEEGELKECVRCSNQTLDALPALCRKYTIRKGIVSSVVSLTDEVRQVLAGLPFSMMEFNHQTPIPIRNLYKTPATLGMYR